MTVIRLQSVNAITHIMDPSKKIGKIKEQVEKEHIARRNYPKKWGKLADPENNKFYNQNEINRQLKECLKLQDLCPFRYTGEGECYFVSPGMYDALFSKCRCARPRTEAHIIRCLQKEKDRFAPKTTEKDIVNEHSTPADVNASEKPKRILPETSNATFGFPRKRPVYQQWEQSMKYISPVYTMPGYRITARPYNAIIIG